MAGERIMTTFVNLHVSPNIIRVIMSRAVSWAGHTARMEEMRSA
jgi:hypothetical protein